MRLLRYWWLCLAAVIPLCFAGQGRAQEPSRAKVGEKVVNLAFKDAQGTIHQLHDLKGKKAIVLVFLSFDCPISSSYSQPLSDMAKEFGKYGVTLWGLSTNTDESRAELAKRAKEYAIAFPVFKDERLLAADALKAEITPEVFVLDGNFVLRYRGRIDDSYSERLKRHTQVTKHELRQTVAELLTGRPVSSAPTRAVGCAVPRFAKKVAKDGAVTYHRDVLPILQHNCQSCHRPGAIGPFALMSYKQAFNWADDIKTFTQNRTMPPWKLVAGMPFHNERHLAERDIKTLAGWVDAGCPEGNVKDAPPPVKFPEGWSLGTPDLVLSPDEDMMVGPTGRDLFRCFVMPTNLTEDVYVTAIEVRPGNPRVVHHTLNYIDTSGQGRKLLKLAQERAAKNADAAQQPDAHGGVGADRGPGYSVAMGVGFLPQGSLSGWAPGMMPHYVPDGVGYFLPKNSDIVMQVHYHRNGRTERDRTQIGLYFAKKKVHRPLQSGVIAGTSGGNKLLKLYFAIPPNDPHYRITGDMWAAGDFTLVSIMPHMHMVGKEIAVTLTLPDGRDQTVLAIKQWDYNWQETYFLKQPLVVKAGTRLHVDAVYDNSSANPRNPFDPPRRVTFGEQTFNEMCFVFLSGYSGTGRRLPLTPVAPKKDAGGTPKQH